MTATRPRILTTVYGQGVSPTWRAASELCAVDNSSRTSSLKGALRLYRRAREYEAVVLDSALTDSFYALLRVLLPFGQPLAFKRGCRWYRAPTYWRRLLKTLQRKMEHKAFDAFFVWASREIEDYSREYGLPRSKFHLLLYHHTLNQLELSPVDCGYVFSGGNFARDYATLLAAVDGLPAPVRIATTRPEVLAGLSVPDNVDVRGYTHEEYLRVMAGCSVNVVALEGGLLHAGGQQTFLNSMALGKPTIVTDPDGARDYIEHGLNGLLVEPGDPAALREAIKSLLEDASLARRLGQTALETAKGFSTEAHFVRLCDFVAERTATRYSPSPNGE